jgi:hypothetical protein
MKSCLSPWAAVSSTSTCLIPAAARGGSTEGWQQYGQHMGYIYHLFANYQRDPSLFEDPRDVMGSRAEPLDTEPEPYQVLPMPAG